MSGGKKSIIPIVDFSNYAIGVRQEDVIHENLTALGQEVCKAFKDIGFVYLVNHGIMQEQIDDVIKAFQRFLSSPADIKHKYKGTIDSCRHGWDPLGSEGLNPQRPNDIKEAFNFLLRHEKSIPDTNGDIPGFSDTMKSMHQNCQTLALRVLHVMGIGLQLQDPEYFCKCHNPYLNDNRTALRSLFYPGITDKQGIVPDQLRCGKHSDFGSITLLFQDNTGGLEVKCRRNEFIPATPVPGAVVINVGDIMQRWSDDVLVSTVHRVMFPVDATLPRHSIAFFVNPDDNTEIVSKKYQPVLFKDYLDMKIKSTYYG